MTDNDPHRYPDLDYVARCNAGPQYAVFISPVCICGWEPVTDEIGAVWLLLERKPACELHGVDGVF